MSLAIRFFLRHDHGNGCQIEEESLNQVIKMNLHLEPEARRYVDGQSKICNWAYNKLLELAINLRTEFVNNQDAEVGKRLYTKRGLRNELPLLKEEFSFLKSVHSSPLKNAALRLSEAISAYQKSRKGRRSGKPTGWPKFRSFKSKWFSLLYDEPGKGFKVDGRELILSLGVDKENRRIRVSATMESSLESFGDGNIRNLRITCEQGRYFAVFTVSKPDPVKKSLSKIIALDPNHKNLAYGVDNEGGAVEISNAGFLKSLDRHIDRLKSKRDRCLRKSLRKTLEDGRTIYRPSKRWQRYDRALRKLYLKRRDQTKCFLYTVGGKLYRHYDLVAIGNYTPKGGGINRGMRRSMNNQSLIGRLKQVLSWLAQRDGKFFEEWDERGSTKTCHVCRAQVDYLTPDIRAWTCSSCQTRHHRDENAAQNGLNRVLNKLNLPCSGRLEVISRCTWRWGGLGIVSMPGCVGGETSGNSEVGTAFMQKLNSKRGSFGPQIVHG